MLVLILNLGIFRRKGKWGEMRRSSDWNKPHAEIIESDIEHQMRRAADKAKLAVELQA